MFAYLNHHKQLKFYKNFEFEAEGAEGEALGKFTVPPTPQILRSPQQPTQNHPKSWEPSIQMISRCALHSDASCPLGIKNGDFRSRDRWFFETDKTRILDVPTSLDASSTTTKLKSPRKTDLKSKKPRMKPSANSPSHPPPKSSDPHNSPPKTIRNHGNHQYK